MIVDCHGHYTTAPQGLWDWRKKQLSEKGSLKGPVFSDDEIRESLEKNQLRLQKERGYDVTFFSPRAGSMEHHVGDAKTSADWSRVCNDLIHRVCSLYPANFAPVCQLPQSPGVDPAGCIGELERCVKELGFIACNLNPRTGPG
jgi:4-oxalmesaconate hydratase